MTTVAIVYFSGYGHTHRQALAVEEGVRQEGAQAVSIRIDEDGNLSEAQWAELATADAIVYGSPTYMGAPAWQFKKFADASSKPWAAQQWKDKIAGGFTTSASVNGDKLSSLQYFFTLSQQHGQIWVGLGLLPSNAKAHGPDDINWTAGFSGAMAIAPSDASPDEAPRNGDLATARLYGGRIARIAGLLSARA